VTSDHGRGAKHPVFERDGIHLRVDVSGDLFVRATLGATIEVPTSHGAP